MHLTIPSNDEKISYELKKFFLNASKSSGDHSAVLERFESIAEILKSHKGGRKLPISEEEFSHIAAKVKGISQSEAKVLWKRKTTDERQKARDAIQGDEDSMKEIRRIRKEDKGIASRVNTSLEEKEVNFHISDGRQFSFRLCNLHQDWQKQFLDSWEKANAKNIERFNKSQYLENLCNSLHEFHQVSHQLTRQALFHLSVQDLNLLDTKLKNREMNIWFDSFVRKEKLQITSRHQDLLVALQEILSN